jgi:hypothetical protein
MNRRDLLKYFAICALDPERVLWIPGRKVYSIPRQVLTIPNLEDAIEELIRQKSYAAMKAASDTMAIYLHASGESPSEKRYSSTLERSMCSMA